MKTFTWYRTSDHPMMLNSFNCIYLIEKPLEGSRVKSYHLMIKDGNIVQIMNGATFIDDDIDVTWTLLENEGLIEEANKWITFIKAKNALKEVDKRIIVSIKNNRLNKVWE